MPLLGHPARLVALKTVNRTISRRLKRQLGDRYAALGAFEIHRVHLPRAAVHATATAIRTAGAASAQAIGAVERLVARRLKRQLGDRGATLGALFVHLIHLPVILVCHRLKLILFNRPLSLYYASFNRWNTKTTVYLRLSTVYRNLKKMSRARHQPPRSENKHKICLHPTQICLHHCFNVVIGRLCVIYNFPASIAHSMSHGNP